MAFSRNFVISVTGALSPIAFIFVTTPIYIHNVGLDAYGTIALVSGLVLYLQFLDFGLGRSLNQRISMRALSPPDGFAYLTYALAITLAIVAAVGLAGALVLLAARWVAAPMAANYLVAAISYNFLSIILMTAAVVAASICSGFLEAYGRFAGSTALQISGSFAFNVAPVFVLDHLHGAQDVILFGSLCRVMLIIPAVLLCWHHTGWTRLRMMRDRTILTYGGWIAGANLINPILETGDRLVVASIVGPAAAAYQAIIYNFVRAIRILPVNAARVTFPALSAVPTEERAAMLAADIMPIVLIVMSWICSLCMCFSEIFITVWINHDVATSVKPALFILLVGLIPNCAAFVPYSFLQARGKAKFVTKLAAAEVVPYLITMIFMSSNWGFIGSAIAYSARIIIDAFIMTAISGIRIKFSIKFIIMIASHIIGILIIIYYDIMISSIYLLITGIISSYYCYGESIKIKKSLYTS